MRNVSLYLLIFTFLFPAMPVEAKWKYHHMESEPCENKVTLTKKQKKKLDKLFDELYEQEKEIFETVENYGLLSKAQKEKHLRMIKKKNEKMKEAKNNWCANN